MSSGYDGGIAAPRLARAGRNVCAKNHGADIFPQISVRHLERQQDRWVLHGQLVDVGRETFDAPTLLVAADLMLLAAGSQGSAEFLLCSKAHGLPLSDKLGHHFTGNGDGEGTPAILISPFTAWDPTRVFRMIGHRLVSASRE
ncbi:MAG: hypothetical protein D6690_10335 [Nitrospirae bacterium]|nr:MAG: hypothetical protein D6690_10335 [Nitrospirota bacterium]